MYGNLAASTALCAHKDEAIDSRVHRAQPIKRHLYIGYRCTSHQPTMCRRRQ